MQVELTSPVEGKFPGEKVDVPDGKARWLLANGYARKDDDGSHLLDSSVEAANDPTLAQNREAPGEPPAALANDEDDKSFTEKVVERAEFKGSRTGGSKRIVPGDPTTQVAALEATLEAREDYDFDADEQPEPSVVVETEDPLKGEDLTQRPDITAADSEPKRTTRRR